LVDYAIESICLQELAAHLPELDTKTRAELKRRLAALPPSLSLADAMRGEKNVFLPWLIQEVKKPNPKDRVLDFVGKVDAQEIQAFKKLDESELLLATTRMGGYYDRMIELVILPPKDVSPRHDQLFQEITNNGAKDFLSRWLLPSAAGGRMSEARHITRLALFQAGLAVADQGQKALEDPQHKDPFGKGSFAYRDTDNGFVLTSDWDLRDGKKLSLTFGKQLNP
jgi:hypothetical protein